MPPLVHQDQHADHQDKEEYLLHARTLPDASACVSDDVRLARTRIDKHPGGPHVFAVSEERPKPTCPICEAPLSADSHAFRPFCSRRCKLLDLSRWLGEEYRVAGTPVGDGGIFAADFDDDLPV